MVSRFEGGIQMTKLERFLLVLVSCFFAFPSLAQETTDEGAIEEVIVTGSFIKRRGQQDSASPIVVVGRESFSENGSVTFDDFVPTLTINAGDEGNSDNFSGPRTQGTANINLRGLGVGANLVLLNGRRQTQAAQTNNDGESFVDIASLVPMIAVDRMEILKDGASSLYGSDAISGVINFITRDDFVGVDISATIQSVTDGGSDEYELSGLWGGGNEKTSFIAAFSILNRTSLDIQERNLAGLETGDPTGVSSSGFGYPGNFVTSGGLVPDPDCDTVAAQDLDGTALGTAVVFGTNQCRWDFSPFLDIVPDEERIQAYTAFTHQMSDLGAVNGLEFRGDFGFARNRSERRLSPSFGPFSQPVSVPAAHPQNPYGEDVTFLGRVTGTDAPALISKTENDTWRATAVFSGDFSESWYFELGGTWSINESQYRQPDTIIGDWQDSINDFSYNPFAISLLVPAGDPAANDPALITRLQDELTLDASTRLYTFDGHVAGDLLDMPAGPLGVAIGFQYRNEEIDYNYDALANQDGYGFFIGNPDFQADRDVSAFFVEFAVPLLETLDLQLAIRYEDYGGSIGSTTNPKIAAKWQPTDALSIRASYSESFKAPTLFQTDGVGTTGSSGVFAFGSFQFPAVRFKANSDDPLVPETADVINVGVTFKPLDNLQIDLDYWSFEFTDIIIREGEGFLIALAAAGDPKGLDQVDFDPVTGVLGQIRSFYLNAQGLDTDGIDLGVRWGLGDSITLTADATFVTDYTFQTEAGPVDGAGFLNAGTIGSPMPELKANLGFAWVTNRHAVNAFVRYIDSYVDQRGNRREFANLESHTTVDAQYVFQWNDATAFTIGAKNIFDEDVPTVRDFMGYDAKTHDARQQLVYARFSLAYD